MISRNHFNNLFNPFGGEATLLTKVKYRLHTPFSRPPRRMGVCIASETWRVNTVEFLK